MNLDAIEQRTRAATEGPWDAEKTADCIRITRDHVPALVARVRELEEENGAAVGTAGALRARVLELEMRETARDERIKELEGALAEAVEMRDVNDRLFKYAVSRANRAESEARAARGTVAALERACENGGKQ